MFCFVFFFFLCTGFVPLCLISKDLNEMILKDQNMVDMREEVLQILC